MRFILLALPLLVLLMALFGAVVVTLDWAPRDASLVSLALFDDQRAPARVVLATWLLEAFGLVALFLLLEGRVGNRLVEGLLTGWIAWIFRGPLLVITIVLAAGQPQEPWWRLALGWLVLYSVAGLALAWLAWSNQRSQERSQMATPTTRADV